MILQQWQNSHWKQLWIALPPQPWERLKRGRPVLSFPCFLEGEQDLLHNLWTGSESVPVNTKMGGCPLKPFRCSYFLGLTWFPKLRFHSRPSTGAASHIPLTQRISWEWELIRGSWVTLATYGLLHWYLVAAEIDSSYSQSLLALENTLSWDLCFSLSLWCMACDLFFLRGRCGGRKELGEWWHNFCGLSLCEVYLFITQENPSIILKGIGILSVYGGQFLCNEWLPFGIKRVNLVSLWYY